MAISASILTKNYVYFFTLNIQNLEPFFLYSATAIRVVAQPHILVYCSLTNLYIYFCLWLVFKFMKSGDNRAKYSPRV